MCTKYLLLLVIFLPFNSILAANCTFTGNVEADNRCRQIQDQEREIARQQARMRQLEDDMARMQAEQAISNMDADPRMQELQKTNPECATALKVWQTEKVAPKGRGLIGMIGAAGKSNRVKAAERQMYKSCNLPDPDCEEAKLEKLQLPTDASQRKIDKADKSILDACSYLDS